MTQCYKQARALLMVVLWLSSMLTLPDEAVAQPGSVDPAFTTDMNASVYSVVPLPDGKVIVGGDFSAINGYSKSKIGRLLPDGSVDQAFGLSPSNSVYTVALQPDGKIIIAGGFTSYNTVNRNRIARLNPDGSLDMSFDSGTIPSTGAGDYIHAIALQPDGKILIGGSFSTYNGSSRNRIARLNADGSLDETFNPGTGTNAVVNAIAVQPDGKILIGGSFTIYNGSSRNRIARLNADGTLDASFIIGSGADNVINCIAIQSDGKMVVGGNFALFNGQFKNRLVRLNTDGSIDASFTSRPSDQVFAIAIQPDGKLYIAGDFIAYNINTTRNRIARVNADGSVDATFDPGPGANARVRTIALLPDKKLLIGGDFTQYGGALNRYRVARLTLKDAPVINNFSNLNKIYGDPAFTLQATSNSTGAITYSVVPGGTGAVTITNGGTVNIQKSGTVTLRATVAEDANYSQKSVDITLTIYPTTPDIAWDDPAPITYGTLLSSTQLNATSSVPGTYSYSPAAGTKLGAGGNQLLSVSFIPTDRINYLDAIAQARITVNKAVPAAAITSANSGTYGDMTSISLNKGGSTGVVTYTVTNGTGSAILAGNNLTLIRAGTITITATIAEDQNYTSKTVSQVFTIHKATPPALIYSANNGAYGSTITLMTSKGNSTGQVSYTVTNETGTASVSGNVLTLTWAGNVAVTAHVDEDVNHNATTATQTITITKAVAGLGLSNLMHAYDGLPKYATVTTLPEGLTGVSVVYKQGTTVVPAPTAIGDYTVEVTLNNHNYTAPMIASTLTISGKAAATISNFGNITKTYGDAPFTLNATSNSTGAITYTKAGGSGDVTISNNTVTLVKAGTVTLQANVAEDANHAAYSAQATLTINKAGATLALGNLSHTYDGTAKAATVTTAPAGLTGVSVVYKQGTTTVATPTAIGSYTVEATLNNVNYTAPMVTGTLTISAKPAATISNFGNITKTYGDEPFTFNATSNSTGAITYFKTSGNGEIVIENNRVTILRAGTVTLLATVAGDANYAAASLPATLTISKAPLVITVHDKTRTYGENNPPLTWSISGFKHGDGSADIDNQPLVGILAGAASPVGTYPLRLEGASDDNYSFSYIDGKLTVTKAALRVIADNKTRYYGDDNPDLTYTYAGFKLGESETSLTNLPELTTTATAESDAGTYQVIPGGAEALNYEITHVPGTLTVTKAPLSVKAGDSRRKYREANPAFFVTYGGLRNGDLAEDLDVVPDISTVAGEYSDVGTYLIIASGGSDQNYEFADYSNGTLTIEKASQVITFPAIGTKNVNDRDFELGATVSSDLEIAYTVSGPATLTERTKIHLTGIAGTVTVTASQAGNHNYEAAHEVVRTFDVNEKLNQVITFSSFTQRTFDQGNLMLNASASSDLRVSFASSDNTVADIKGNELIVKKPGTVIITASQEGNDVYNAAPEVSHTLTIIKGMQAIVFGALPESTVGDEPFRLQATASSALAISYTSSNTEVATISGDLVTIVGEGETVITANQTGNDFFAAAKAETQKLVVKLITDAETAADRAASVYPNPARDRVVVETAETCKGSTVRVTDLHGRTMNAPALEVNEYTHSLDVSQLPAGVYQVQVSKGNRIVSTTRIVKIN